MSQWTHVNCSIRIDGLAGLMPVPDLGKTVGFGHDERAWAECDVPCGSEGSLQTSLSTSDDPHALARYVATIWGDLRDYDNEDLIIKYLDRITKGQMVRSGIAVIDVERIGRTIVLFDDDSKTWKKVNQTPEP